MIHDVIKIQYSREGYLPNYPPHLISDKEMFDAFLKFDSREQFEASTELSYFKDNYPCIVSDSEYITVKDAQGNDVPVKDSEGNMMTWKDGYYAVVECIADEIQRYNESLDVDKSLPNWIYSYMLGSVVSVNDSQLDIHDLLVLLGIDNPYDEFLEECCRACYYVSRKYLNKIPPSRETNRPPGLFGELHVIKQLKLDEAGI